MNRESHALNARIRKRWRVAVKNRHQIEPPALRLHGAVRLRSATEQHLADPVNHTTDGGDRAKAGRDLVEERPLVRDEGRDRIARAITSGLRTATFVEDR
jgi:hypothetical protein